MPATFVELDESTEGGEFAEELKRALDVAARIFSSAGDDAFVGVVSTREMLTDEPGIVIGDDGVRFVGEFVDLANFLTRGVDGAPMGLKQAN